MAERIHRKNDSGAALPARELDGTERLQEISSPLIEQDNVAPRHQTDTDATKQNASLHYCFDVETKLR